MSRLTFEDLTPDDMPEPFHDDSGDRADAYRDSLADLSDNRHMRLTPMTTVTPEQMLEHRTHESHIDDSWSDEIATIADDINALLTGRGFDAMNAEQLQALWCEAPCDAFGMLNDLTARLSLDEEKMRDISARLFECLDDDASVLVLSDIFASYVRRDLTADQLVQVIARNISDGSDQSDSVCHSHDFIDTNETMLEAVDALGLEWQADSHQFMRMVNDAWTLAKRRGFAEVFE